MSADKIREYAKLMQEYDLSCIEIEEEGQKIKIEKCPKPPKGRPPMGPLPMGPGPDPKAGPEGYAQGKKEDKAEEKKPEVSYDGDVVSCPMVGVFYAAPAENADPFVKVGDRVKKGDTLCIVEAMKLMNEITAEFDGKIVEILAENGQTVDYGTPLFVMER